MPDDGTGLIGTEVAAEPPVEQPVEDATEFEVPSGEGAEPAESQVEPVAEEPTAPPEEAAPAPVPPREVLPRELSRALREMREAHPEHGDALRSLDKAFYSARNYREVFPSVEDARTAKSTLETLGGPDGITRMRAEIQASRDLDSMAQQGDPRTIQALAESFPDGFKKLVPAALERLSNMDRAAYIEAMRGPLLQMLEGDGLVQEITVAKEELKAGNADRASRSLDAILHWYNQNKQKDTEIKNRWQDPRVQELEKRERDVQSQQARMMMDHAYREASAYLSGSLDRTLRQMTQGMKISTDGVADLKQSVTQEVWMNLRGNDFYMQSTADLLRQGDIDRVLAFARPYIDQATKAVVPKVWARRYGSLPSARRTAPAQPQPLNQATTPATPRPMPASSTGTNGQPIPVTKKPSMSDLDMSKDPSLVNYIAGQGWLKNGKFVRWAGTAKR
jgi:hypothetical protein